MPTAQKTAKLSTIKDLFSDHDNAILTEYRGLTVTQISLLRRELSKSDTTYKVFKNTLVRKVVSDLGVEGMGDSLKGPTAIAFVKGDIAAAAKSISTFAKGNPDLVIKGGLLSGKAIDGSQVRTLASLPSREQLIGQLLGTLNAPIGGFVRVIAAPTRALVTVLDRIAQQKA